MTFSISARCAATGTIGMAVASSSPAVAARCIHARAEVGAVATQNVTDPALGPLGLDLLAGGLEACAALQGIVAGRPFIEHRQITVLDRQGRSAAFSGRQTLGLHATAQGENVVAAGNLLADPRVPAAMVEAFAQAAGPLGDRLIRAMRAAVAAGGEAGPVHSAGLLLVRDLSWPIADLRIDWSEGDAVEGLADLWARYHPQLEAYVTRALDPRDAPGFDVPGER